MKSRSLRFIETVKEGNRFELWYLGTVLDPVNLKPEVLTVLILHERDLEFKEWKVSWETKGDLYWKDFNKRELGMVLGQGNTVPTGRAHLHLVHHHFRFLEGKVNQFTPPLPRQQSRHSRLRSTHKLTRTRIG